MYIVGLLCFFIGMFGEIYNHDGGSNSRLYNPSHNQSDTTLPRLPRWADIPLVSLLVTGLIIVTAVRLVQ